MNEAEQQILNDKIDKLDQYEHIEKQIQKLKAKQTELAERERIVEHNEKLVIQIIENAFEVWNAMKK